MTVSTFDLMEKAAYDVGMQARADGLVDESLAMFGAEDQMNQDFRERLWHRSLALSGLGGVGFGRVPRALPWADEFKPLWAEINDRQLRSGCLRLMGGP